MMLREDQGLFATWKSAGFIPAFISGVGLFIIVWFKGRSSRWHGIIPYLSLQYLSLKWVLLLLWQWCPQCGLPCASLLAQWWKGGSTALGAQVEGKTLRHLCQKHVGDRRGRPGARSGYCWVSLVDCPKIRARCQVLWWDVTPCWGMFWCDIRKSTFPSHDSDLCLAGISIWQSLPLDFTAEKQAENWSIWREISLSEGCRTFPWWLQPAIKVKKKPGSLCELCFPSLSLIFPF